MNVRNVVRMSATSVSQNSTVSALNAMRKTRFENDYFIGVEDNKLIITNRRSMTDFHEKLTQLLKEYGVDIDVENFNPQGDDWP